MGCCGGRNVVPEEDELMEKMLAREKERAAEQQPIAAAAKKNSEENATAEDKPSEATVPALPDIREVVSQGGDESTESSIPLEGTMGKWRAQSATGALAANGAYVEGLVEDGLLSETGNDRRVSFAASSPPAPSLTPSPASRPLPSTATPNVQPMSLQPLSVTRCSACFTALPAPNMTFCGYCGAAVSSAGDGYSPPRSVPPFVEPPAVTFTLPEPPPLPRLDVDDGFYDSAAPPSIKVAEKLLQEAVRTAGEIERELEYQDRLARSLQVQELQHQQTFLQQPHQHQQQHLRSVLAQLIKERRLLQEAMVQLPEGHPEGKVYALSLAERDQTIELLQQKLQNEGFSPRRQHAFAV